MIDADIEFQQSLLRLYKEFDKFGPNQLFGLAKDMSPYYRTVLYQYRRENPGTEHGDVGRLQGLNTGVALFHLQRMRESQEFAEYLHHDNIKKVCDKFHFKGFIGDQVEIRIFPSEVKMYKSSLQDWWNIVAWDRPELLYFLDCGFNFQLRGEFNRPPFDKVLYSQFYFFPHISSFQLFAEYHNCDSKVMIKHGHNM